MNIEDGLQFVAGMEVWELLIMLGVGVLLLAFGYRIKKIAFFVMWFILGYLIMSYFMPQIIAVSPEIAGNELIQILLPFGGGAVLALLGFSIEKFCVAALCFILVMFIAVTNFGFETMTIVVGLILGVVAGGLGTALMKPATVIVMAAAGGYIFTLALLALIPEIDKTIFLWPITVGLAAIGAIGQFLMMRKR